MTKARSNATAPAAKGEIVVGTGSDVSGILGVGNSGDTLVANSSASVGLSWNPPVGSLANPVINGGMDIWQRGTSIAIGTGFTYSADRWQGYRNTLASGMTVSRQTVSDSTNLPNIQFAARIQRDSGNTSAQLLAFGSSLETTNSIPFAGKTITLSFYARAGANYSSGSSALTAKLFTGTGTDQNILSAGYTGQANPINQTATLTTTWQRFAYSVTLAATTTEIGLEFSYTPSGTASTNDWFEITGVQIDVGTWTASTAPTFRRSGGTLAGEFQACLRYYWRSEAGSAQQKFAQGPAYNTTNALLNPITMPTPMRVKPTALDSGGTIWFQQHAGAGGINPTAIAISADYSNTKQVVIAVDAASGMTAGTIYELKANSSSTAFIGFSAEL